VPALPAPRLALLALALAAPASARVAVGEPLENPEMATLEGGRDTLLSARGEVSVFLFARPGQEHSAEALRQMAECSSGFAGRPVRFVVVVSGSFPPAEVQRAVDAAGLRVPVLLDPGDALYDRLGVRLHPVVGIADQLRRLAAFVPYRAVNYCDSVKARVRFLLGEIGAAELERALAPPRADMPGASPEAVAGRDVMLGRRQLEQGLAEKALASAERAMATAPGLASARGLAALALARLARCPEALERAEAALKLSPAEPSALAARSACAR